MRLSFAIAVSFIVEYQRNESRCQSCVRDLKTPSPHVQSTHVCTIYAYYS